MKLKDILDFSFFSRFGDGLWVFWVWFGEGVVFYGVVLEVVCGLVLYFTSKML